MHEEVTAARHECFPILFVHSIVVRRNFFAASQNVIGAYRTNQRELDEAGRFRFTTTMQQYVTKTTLQQYVTDTRLSPFVHSCGNGRVAVPVRTVANGWRHFIVQPC